MRSQLDSSLEMLYLKERDCSLLVLTRSFLMVHWARGLRAAIMHTPHRQLVSLDTFFSEMFEQLTNDSFTAPGDYGMIVYSEEKLKSMFETAVSNDLQLAVHAIGDKTNTVVLELLAGLQKKPLAGSTIEHAQLLRLEDVKHFSDLGLAASIQPQHMNDDRELIERFWPGRTDRAYMFKTLHEAGVELRLGSDAPVAPLDPWVALAAAVWRARPTDDTDTYSWHPEQKLSMEIAYQASTSGRRISIKEGDVADLCVLPVDPLQATSKQIWEMKVKATLLAGKFTHREL